MWLAGTGLRGAVATIERAAGKDREVRWQCLLSKLLILNVLLNSIVLSVLRFVVFSYRIQQTKGGAWSLAERKMNFSSRHPH